MLDASYTTGGRLNAALSSADGSEVALALNGASDRPLVAEGGAGSAPSGRPLVLD
jgi:hypothetical protein